MLTGYNTDINFRGTVYHVQTEDKGNDNPVIETLLYVGGQILDSKRTSYSEISGEKYNPKNVEKLLEDQHRGMIQKIRSGFYEKNFATETIEINREELEGKSGNDDSVGQPDATNRTLDEIILDYLEKESEKAKLELGLVDKVDFITGRQVSLKIYARNSLARTPMKGVEITIKLISTISPPQVLYEGTTDELGTAKVSISIPPLGEGNAAIVIRGKSSLGNDEFKQFVKRSA